MAPGSTLLDRVDWVRVNKAGGIKWTPFARASGLSGSALNTWRHRAQKNPTAALDLRSQRKIARTWAVPLDWLVDGTGSPEPSAQVDELEAAIASDSWPPDVIACARKRRQDGFGPYNQEAWIAWLTGVTAACNAIPSRRQVRRKEPIIAVQGAEQAAPDTAPRRGSRSPSRR